MITLDKQGFTQNGGPLEVDCLFDVHVGRVIPGWLGTSSLHLRRGECHGQCIGVQSTSPLIGHARGTVLCGVVYHLRTSLSPTQNKLRLVSSFGAGLLIGAALIVIIPEGVELLMKEGKSRIEGDL